jgi:hypothetical protein
MLPCNLKIRLIRVNLLTETMLPKGTVRTGIKGITTRIGIRITIRTITRTGTKMSIRTRIHNIKVVGITRTRTTTLRVEQDCTITDITSAVHVPTMLLLSKL